MLVFLAAIRSDSSEVGRPRLKEWLLAAEPMNMEEFKDCTRAYRNWFQ